MEVIVTSLDKRLREGTIHLSEFLVNYLYIEGYISKEEFDKHLLDNTYTPKLEVQNEDPFPETLQLKVEREDYVENKRNNRDLDLTFFT
jgi:hypothetical protein